ncbi:hypothetical protein [Roseospira visakhapatnamensis]|uniref:Uncharacterized protein n=1 Tax=Roseospira visakhapatnamensis TaxID=390880 RepID=A0A7W6RF74_9PROT|nr:hypothetical protein [Roseospira visakhapatnamensis]MBB4266833.1 hypothetical protein [Roseospira visakhapatnamensis]
MTKRFVATLAGCMMLAIAPAFAGEPGPTLLAANPGVSLGTGLNGAAAPMSSGGTLLISDTKEMACETDADCASAGDHMKCDHNVCVKAE